MKFLIDQNLSPLVAGLLRSSGHDAQHVEELGLSRATDHDLLALARSPESVVISADTDFGDLLALSGESGPSVILLRREQGRRAAQIADLILTNLEAVTTDLSDGAIVVLDARRIRVRSLPIR